MLDRATFLTRRSDTRRCLLFLAAVFASCLTGTWDAPARSWAQEAAAWTSFQGGAAHPGASSTATVRPPLRKAWLLRAPSGQGGFSGIAAMPGLGVATTSTSVIGFDPTQGRQLWTLPRARSPALTPALVPSEGERGTVVYAEGDSRATSALVAVDAANRTRAWRLSLGDLAIGAPCVDEGTALIGSRDRYVYAVDVRTGSLRWKRRLEGSAVSAPAASGGRVFALTEEPSTGRARLYALAEATGRTLWSSSPPAAAAASTAPSVAQGRVYVGFGDQVVRSFIARTGTLAWSEPVREYLSPLSSPAVSGQEVLVQDRQGGVYRLDAATGRRTWDFQLPSPSESGAPIVVGGTIYVGLDDGTVAAIAADSGHLVWRSTFPFGVVGPLTPFGDLLLAPLSGSGGAIVALRHDPNGTLLDRRSPTELDLPVAVANFGLAFLLISAVVLGLFHLAARWAGRADGSSRTARGMPES